MLIRWMATTKEEINFDIEYICLDCLKVKKEQVSRERFWTGHFDYCGCKVPVNCLKEANYDYKWR